MAYWLDADTLITAKNGFFAFEINSSLWAWLDEQLNARRVMSPERVFREIMAFKPNDPLKQWVATRKTNGLCVEPDKRVSQALGRIADHLYTATLTHPKTKKPQARYKPAQVEIFGRGADAFVIAHAMAEGGSVVTFESAKHPESQKIRVPDVCSHFNVPCIDLRQLLVTLGAKL